MNGPSQIVLGSPGADRRRCRSDGGQVAGIEVLPFGFLVFVVGTLLLVNAWAVVDTRMALAAAAREGARAAAETVTGADDARAAADAAARQALDAHGRLDDRTDDVAVSFPSGYGRCRPVAVTVGYRVPAINLPWIGGFGTGIDVTVTASERVDAYRSAPLEPEACSDG